VQRDQLPNRDAVSRDDERLAPIQASHDLTALVAELSLGDLSTHGFMVARVLRGSALVCRRSIPFDLLAEQAGIVRG